MHVCMCMYTLTCLKVNGNVFIVLKGHLDNVSIHLLSSVYCSYYGNQTLFPSKLQNLVKLFTETKHVRNLGFLLGGNGEGIDRWYKKILRAVVFLHGVRRTF